MTGNIFYISIRGVADSKVSNTLSEVPCAVEISVFKASLEQQISLCIWLCG
uniref:Uncharacterized protein n=1 Tax=Arion vulgaris TaxID=1028688 RepID=A0A0B6ZXQ9_9EUPU